MMRFIALSLTTTSMMALAAPATAQQAALTSPHAQTPEPQAAAADTGIADIVVTAQRRSENLQKTALAVSAVDAAALRNAGISQPSDLTKLVPALQLAPLGGGGTQVTIRGVGNFAPFLYSEPAVAINYDGVYLARSAAPNGLFFDLERVEVLKGPQGTLYGRNATGGAINVISAKPVISGIHAAGDIEAGNFGLIRGSAMINLPLGEDVALRIAGQAISRGGYLSDGYLDDKGQAIRGQLLFKPTGALSINLAADYIHQGGKGPGGVFAPGGFLVPSDPYRGATSPESQALLRGASLGITGGANPNFLPPFGTDGYTNVKSWGISATINYNLGFGNLTVLPAYRNTANDFKHYVGGFPLISTERSEQETVEVRLSSANRSPIKWVVGGYYFHDASSLYSDARQGIARTITIASALPVDSAAGFGQVTVPLTSRFRVTGGVRYTDETKSQTGQNISDLPPVPTGFPAPAIVFYNAVCPAPAATLNVAAGTCTGPFAGRVHYKKVTWKGGVEFDAGPNSLIYASAEQGFKAGGFYPSLPPNTFRPEKIFALTLGSKNRFFGNTLQFNAEAFYWKYTDKQVSHLGPVLPEGYGIITENAGKATIYGAEADLIWRPTRADRLSVNLQYVKSKYDTFLYSVPLLSATATKAAVTCPQTVATSITGARTATVDCAGQVLPQTPRWTLNASYQRTFEIANQAKVEAIVGTKVQSSFYVGEEFLSGEFQGTSMVSYASLTYRAPGDRFSVGAYVDNIENQAVKASSFVQPAIGVPVVILRAPRTFGARAGFRF
ncbi:TonB-dependent receptor [Sphingomonas sp. UYEF23]|uniref:TonB-dependent receptor n=1 Tax=Sphingomonas sp. UYEF23 TaxID=1756408 RepID=UPI00339840FE